MRNHRWIWIVGMAAPLIVLAQTAPKDIAALSVTPAEVTFRSADEGMHVLVTGTTAEGEKIDLSSSAQFTPAEPIVKVGDDGLLHPVRQGDTKVTVMAGGRQAQLMAHVGDLSKPAQVSFIRDVEPVLNKVGWPGRANAYRLDFQVPDGTAAGTATIQLSAAWIEGPGARPSS